MPKFQDLSLGNRIAITAVLVLVLLFALALFGWWSGGWDENSARSFDMASAETRPELCMDGDTRERVRSLMFVALDDSLKKKIEELFSVWLRDATDQPRRAQKGMQGALLAYTGARGQAMKFNPPECP